MVTHSSRSSQKHRIPHDPLLPPPPPATSQMPGTPRELGRSPTATTKTLAAESAGGVLKWPTPSTFIAAFALDLART